MDEPTEEKTSVEISVNCKVVLPAALMERYEIDDEYVAWLMQDAATAAVQKLGRDRESVIQKHMLRERLMAIAAKEPGKEPEPKD